MSYECWWEVLSLSGQNKIFNILYQTIYKSINLVGVNFLYLNDLRRVLKKYQDNNFYYNQITLKNKNRKTPLCFLVNGKYTSSLS